VPILVKTGQEMRPRDAVHNTTQNSSDTLTSYPSENLHSSVIV